MKHLLVYSYFCPVSTHRPGGVQQIVEPMLSALRQTGRWHVTVAHAGPCSASADHVSLPDPADLSHRSGVAPHRLTEAAQEFRKLAADYDVILSVDRVLPSCVPVPSVLMCNTLAYYTEAVATMAVGWDLIVVPTQVLATSVHAVNPNSPLQVIHYGLSDEVRRAAQDATSPDDSQPALVRLPHRPDPRKGHIEALEGLPEALRDARDIRLHVSWLDEERYLGYRRELESLAHRLQVQEHVEFVPWLDGEQQRTAILSSHATLQVGSFIESFGLSLIESIIFGRLAVVSYQPAVREVVGSSELLVEVAQPHRWYSAMRRTWQEARNEVRDLRDRQRLIGKLSLDRMTAEYEHVLVKAVEQSSRFRSRSTLQ